MKYYERKWKSLETGTVFGATKNRLYPWCSRRQNPHAPETAVVITKEEVVDIFGFTEKARPEISIYIREKFLQT
jgi:hypothetical protein